MKITRIALSELKAPEKNVRIHSAKQLEEFKRSVAMFGQIRPIVVDENNVMLAGNGLCEAMKALGRTEADCYVVTDLTENEKRKLMLADNRIFSLGIDDLDAFDSIIAELGTDIDVPGYDEDLLKTLTSDLEDIDDIIGGYGLLDDDNKAKIEHNTEVVKRESEAFLNGAEQLAPRSQLQPSQMDGNSVNNKDIVQQTEDAETAPTPLQRRYIVCPKCGEKIWL